MNLRNGTEHCTKTETSSAFIFDHFFFISVMHTNLGDLLFGNGQPDLTPPCVQLLNGQMFLLHHGQWCIMGELGEDLGDVRAPLFQKLSLPTFLLLLHLFQFGWEKKKKIDINKKK